MLPKASYMESTGPKNDRIGFAAAAPHVVIVCPSCKTSFAVETAVVASLETPRFHCSRCDDIFVLKDPPSDSKAIPSLQAQSLSRKQNEIAHRSAASSAMRESLIKPSDFSITPSTETFAIPEPAEQIAEESIETPQAPRSTLSLLSQGFIDAEEPLPSKEEEHAVETRVFEPLPVVEEVSSRKFVLSDPTPAQNPVQKSPQTPTPVPTPTPKGVQPPTAAQTAPQSNSIKTEPYRPPLPKRSEPQQTELTKTERTKTERTSLPSEGRRFSPRMQGLVTLSLPILAALTTLLGLSYSARLSPSSVDAVANLSMPAFAKGAVSHLPPASLTIRNISFKFEKTRSKEIIGVVSGSLFNQSGKSIEGVELEALGFNERGEIVLSSRSPLKSALSQEKISDLPLDTVRRYQSEINARDATIAGKENVPFTIALINNRNKDTEDTESEPVDLSKVKYFSARVFSVR